MNQQNEPLKSMIIGFGAAGYAAPVYYSPKTALSTVPYKEHVEAGKPRKSMTTENYPDHHDGIMEIDTLAVKYSELGDSPLRQWICSFL